MRILVAIFLFYNEWLFNEMMILNKDLIRSQKLPNTKELPLNNSIHGQGPLSISFVINDGGWISGGGRWVMNVVTG